ncbi:MAG: SDR family oxidoreductase [Balneolaceae bacterium]
MKINFRQKPLHEQVIVITGGSSGIGLACARLACSKGARVVITSNNESELQEAKDNLSRDGHKIESIAADVADYEAVVSVADFTLETFGRFDTWVNNAGIHIFGKIERNDTRDMRRVFDVNYWGAVHGSRVAVKHLQKSGGTLINIGSVLSARSVPLQGIYGASKHALQGYTDALRMELEKTNAPVAVTLIKPSSISTPIPYHSKNIMPERARLPFPLYDPEVAADVILFCAENPRRSFIVGGAGKGAVTGEKFFPALVDKAMETVVWNMQKAKGEPRREDALHEPTEHSPRIRGDHDYYVRKFSLYNAAAKNPVIAVITGGLTAALGFLLFKRKGG